MEIKLNDVYGKRFEEIVKVFQDNGIELINTLACPVACFDEVEEGRITRLVHISDLIVGFKEEYIEIVAHPSHHWATDGNWYHSIDSSNLYMITNDKKDQLFWMPKAKNMA